MVTHEAKPMTIIKMDVLYKTTDPEHLEHREKPEDFASAEYRQLVVKRGEGDDGTLTYLFTVFQGWWDEAAKEPKHSRQIVEIPYNSRAAAEQAYKDQLDSLIAQGFIYSFIHPGPFLDHERQKYRVLKSGDEA
jgi:hypothetical protein